MPHRARLLHVMDYAPRGTRAVDHFILSLIREAQSQGWEMRFGFSTAPAGTFPDTLRELGVGFETFEHPLTRRRVREFARKFGDWQPDVTQTSFLSAFEWPVLWLKLSGFTKKLIVLDHSSGVGPSPRSWLRPLRWVRGRAVGRVVDAFAPVSAYVGRRQAESVYLPAAKIRVIPNGIDLARFPFRPRTSGDVLRVGYVGQLIAEKGVLTLLEAVRRLAAAGSRPFQLDIAGAGEQRPELEAFCAANGLGNVNFLGHIDSVADFFAACDLAVIPSEWAEAFGLVAIEAMASGTPLVVSDAGGLPDIVTGVGLVFPAGDAGQLAERMGSLLENPELRRTFAIAGRQRVEERFTLARKVWEHINLCNELVGRPTTPRPNLPKSCPVL